MNTYTTNTVTFQDRNQTRYKNAVKVLAAASQAMDFSIGVVFSTCGRAGVVVGGDAMSVDRGLKLAVRRIREVVEDGGSWRVSVTDQPQRVVPTAESLALRLVGRVLAYDGDSHVIAGAVEMAERYGFGTRADSGSETTGGTVAAMLVREVCVCTLAGQEDTGPILAVYTDYDDAVAWTTRGQGRACRVRLAAEVDGRLHVMMPVAVAP